MATKKSKTTKTLKKLKILSKSLSSETYEMESQFREGTFRYKILTVKFEAPILTPEWEGRYKNKASLLLAKAGMRKAKLRIAVDPSFDIENAITAIVVLDDNGEIESVSAAEDGSDTILIGDYNSIAAELGV